MPSARLSCLICVALLGCHEAAPPGDLQWESRAGGAGDDLARDIAVGPTGAVVVTGVIEGTAVFGTGEPTETALTSRGAKDAFVAKYAVDGSLQWARAFGGADNDGGNGIAVARDSSIIITGFFRGQATFAADPEGAVTITAAATGGDEMFLAKLAPDGTLQWVRAAGGGNHDIGHDVAIGRDGSIVVAGEFQSQATFGGGELAETVLTSAGVVDIFVACFHPNGALDWARAAGGRAGDIATAVAVTDDGSVLVTGEFRQSAVFGQNEAGETRLTAVAGSNIFVARLNARGDLTWATRAGTGSDEETSDAVGWDLAAAPDGSIFVVGEFGDRAIFGSGEASETALTAVGLKNLFVAKLGADGSLRWARQSFGPLLDVGTGVAATADGGALITGRFHQQTSLRGGPADAVSLEALGVYDVVTARYDRLGTLVWAERAGGYTGDDYAYGVATVPDGSAVVAGAFGDHIFFGDDEANQPWLDSAGGRDIFVAKLPP